MSCWTTRRSYDQEWPPHRLRLGRPFGNRHPVTRCAAAVVVVCLGITDAVGMATRQTTVQLTTPDNMRGRAVSFHEVSAESANNIGTIEVGFMSQQIGASYTMVLGGIVSIAVVIAVWVFMKGIRQYRFP